MRSASLRPHRFEILLQADLEACRQILPYVLSKGAVVESNGWRNENTRSLSLGLNALATLISFGKKNEALAAIKASDAAEAFEVVTHALEMSSSPSLREKLAPERVALAESFLGFVDSRTKQIAASEKIGFIPTVEIDLSANLETPPEDVSDSKQKFTANLTISVTSLVAPASTAEIC